MTGKAIVLSNVLLSVLKMPRGNVAVFHTIKKKNPEISSQADMHTVRNMAS